MLDGIGIFSPVLVENIRTLLIRFCDYGHRLIIRIVWTVILLSVTAACSANLMNTKLTTAASTVLPRLYIGNHEVLSIPRFPYDATA